ELAHRLPSQTLVEVGHRELADRRVYRGVVVQGPFYEPNGLRADAAPLVIMTAKGKPFMPDYHGRVWIEILGEIAGETLVPPRYRPQPNSPVFVLGEEETAAALKIDGDVTLGVAIGHDSMEVSFPSTRKSVLPRHTAILGTTGGGKSTTVANQIKEQQEAGVATILIDTEGEYSHLGEPTDDERMIRALRLRGKEPEGVKNTFIYHLVGRDTTNPGHPNRRAFTLPFDSLPAEMVMEILEMSEPQRERYWKAYEIGRVLMMRQEFSPENHADRENLIQLDETERGFPHLTLEVMYDIVQACKLKIQDELRKPDGEPNFYMRSRVLYQNRQVFLSLIEQTQIPSHYLSWGKVQGYLGRLLRLRIFDNADAQVLDYDALTTPGRVSIVDLSDTDSPQINNLAIAELLRGVLEQQNRHYHAARKTGAEQRRVVVIVEEAHEFLSEARVRQMPALFEQVARIAKRGRKRWLGLTFVTQLPQHLPDDVLGLVNNYILHKITDAAVISRLKKSAGGIDEALWQRLPGLTEGQAIVKMESMTRPLLVAMYPAPCKLLMVD
ncbi:MAG TPA: ATP-binding protein, partial [Longimicrobium sp.]|nr:ATP-binding protein [Longimicrobium sp.]